MTRELLRSVFGDADNLRAVARWAHQVGEGRPRVTMELAQHLVDRGIARHRAGHWQLPEDLSVLDLPENLEQVMQARVAGLGAAAREVGVTLALLDMVAPEPLSVEQCAQLLSDLLGAGQFFAGLDELIAAGFTVLSDGRHAFASATHCNAAREQRERRGRARDPRPHRGVLCVRVRRAATPRALPLPARGRWAPVLEYALASRQLMVGDAAASLPRFETALRLGPLGACAVGDLFADGYLRALLQVGAVERAAGHAAAIEARMAELDLRPMHARMLEVTLALCQARRGQTAAARERLMRQLAVIDAAGQRGLPRGNLHEALAYIAMIEGDRGRCDAHVQRMGDEFRPGGLPGLVARHERLQAAARMHWSRATLEIDTAAAVSESDRAAPPDDVVTAVEPADVSGVRRASEPAGEDDS